MKRFSLPFEVLQFKDFKLIWTGTFISQIGAEMLIVGLNWQLYSMTHSAMSLGIIGIVRFIPVLLFSLIAGLLADHTDRKKLIMAAQTLCIAASLILAFLTFTNHVSPLAIYILISLYATGIAFSSPAKHAILPHLVPKSHFMQAVSLNSLMWQTAMIIGPSIGGFIIGFMGVGYIYLVSTLGFICMNCVVFFINSIPKSPPTEDRISLQSLKEGIRFVRNTPLIWSTMFLDFFATFFASSMTLMPIFAKEILNVGPQGLGFLYAAPSIGALMAGLVFSSRITSIKNQGKILVGSILVYAVATICFGFSTWFPLSLFCMAFVGAGDMISSIIRNTMRQIITPDHVRGRMVSINMLFYMGGPYLGETEAGFAATLLGTPLSVVAGGIGTVLATIAIVKAVPGLMKYNPQLETRQPPFANL